MTLFHSVLGSSERLWCYFKDLAHIVLSNSMLMSHRKLWHMLLVRHCLELQYQHRLKELLCISKRDPARLLHR